MSNAGLELVQTGEMEGLYNCAQGYDRKLASIDMWKTKYLSNETHKTQVRSLEQYLNMCKQKKKRTVATPNSCNQQKLSPAKIGLH